MSTVRVRTRRFGFALLAGALAVTVAGVGTASASSRDEASTQKSSEPVNVRLGYFPNVTHAPRSSVWKAASSRRRSARTRST